MSLGFSVMVNRLMGGQAFDASVARDAVISSLSIDDDVLKIGFEDGRTLKVRDDGQSCCESRYLTCDDNLAEFVGARFQNIEVRDSDETVVSEYGEEHEVQFLHVVTSKGVFTVATHNEHNGYYGGFSLQAEIV